MTAITFATCVQPVGDSWRASCSCDWIGPDRPHKQRAHQDALDHIGAQHYPALRSPEPLEGA